MICRAEPNTLMLFNAEHGITAAISGSELCSLKYYLVKGIKNEFIYRLIDLKLIPENMPKDEAYNLLSEIEKTKNVTSPPSSFAVPESIHIDLTTVCPLKCPHCYKDTTQNTQLPFEKFSEIIDEAKELGVFQIALGGGEPLLVDRLPTFIKKVSSYNMTCTITTSGFGLTTKLLEELKSAGVNHIQVSLNGSTREINAYSRDGFEHAISALDVLSKSDVLFGINWVARMDNIKDFDNVVVYAKSLKADNINVLRYKPVVKENYIKNALTHEAFYTLAETMKKVSGIKIKVDCAFSNLLCYLHKNQISPISSGCGAGRRFMMIDPKGRFKPCSHMGLVSERQDILKYWISSPDLEKLRQCDKSINEECKSCSYLDVCHGCQAICEKIDTDRGVEKNSCPAFIKKEMV